MKDRSNKIKTFKITPAGSLGILALGDIGLREWRKVKRESNQKRKTDEKK